MSCLLCYILMLLIISNLLLLDLIDEPLEEVDEELELVEEEHDEDEQLENEDDDEEQLELHSQLQRDEEVDLEEQDE